MEVKTYTTIFDKAKAAYGTGAYDDATLEFLFPDLKVSEDERIKKHIVEILKRRPGCHWYGQKEKDDCLVYLEKQKEQKHPNGCFTCDEYKKGYEEGRRNGFTAGYNKAMKEVEQKPRDYRKLYEEVVNSEWFKQNYVGKSLGEEENPKEWSEADENMLNSCISSIEEAKENRYAYKETDGDTSYDHEIAWLKSLRPQPHWKPSEAHLSALLAVFNDPNNIGSQTCQLALTDLYDQLNKL